MPEEMAVSGRTLFDYIEMKTAGFLSDWRRNSALVISVILSSILFIIER